jgi:IS605 OrfB family transposase
MPGRNRILGQAARSAAAPWWLLGRGAAGSWRRKEARWAKDINHKIAKHVVAEAERTGRGIALEDLTGIRERVRLRKPQRAIHASWSFAQLGAFIAYKARKAGVPVVHVDPAYTSRTCAECGHIDKANRVSQAWFACRSCGFVDHADRNGSRNIRARAWGLWRRGARSTAPDPPPTPRGGTGRKRSITASDARCASPALWRWVVDVLVRRDAVLVSGLGATLPEVIGEPYEDADGVPYLPMFRQPVLVFEGTKETLRRPTPARSPGRCRARSSPPTSSPRAMTGTTARRCGPCGRTTSTWSDWRCTAPGTRWTRY